MAIENPEERLAYLAFNSLFPDDYTGDPAVDEQHETYLALLQRIRDLWDGLDLTTKETLDTVNRDHVEGMTSRPEIRAALWRVLADSVLEDYATQQSVEPIPEIPGRARSLRLAAIRFSVGRATDSDHEMLKRWLSGAAVDLSDEPNDASIDAGGDGADDGGADDGDGGADGTDDGDGDDGDGTAMIEIDSTDDVFVIDQRNLPISFREAAAQKTFKHVVIARSRERDLKVRDAKDRGQIGYVMGSLIRSGYFSSKSPGFESAYSAEYNKGFTEVESTARRTIARDVYWRVAEEITKIKDARATVQEISAVSDAVIELGPVNDSNFRAKVRAAHTDYVAREPTFDTLELPDIVTDDTAQAEVEPANVRAVAMIYAASHLESLIQATDLIAQDWTDGYIPVGELASRELDAYVWHARDRLDGAAREIQSSKIEGIDTHLLRFCSATSERDRARFLSEYLVGDSRRTSAQPRDAAVRKAARDLLAFASLHGWAYAQSASKRLGNHIRQCTNIVSNPEIQKAYGVQGPWQLVERAHHMATGMMPPVARDRSLASTGKEILDLLATKSKDIAASLARQPLFPVDDPKGGGSIFSVQEYETLLVHVENWLAAKGINDSERLSASRISDSSSAPSLPTFGGSGAGGGFGGSGFDANAARDQLMQIAAAGQVPDVDQINQLFKIGI